MVRYPHTATVTVVETTVSGGEYQGQSELNPTIRGRLELDPPIRVRDKNGEWTNLKAAFFTKAGKIDGAEKLAVNGESFDIIKWVENQTYNEIWLD